MKVEDSATKTAIDAAKAAEPGVISVSLAVPILPLLLTMIPVEEIIDRALKILL